MSAISEVQERFYHQAVERGLHTLTESLSYKRLAALSAASAYPSIDWLHAVHDTAAENDLNCFLNPMRGRRVLAIGGTGFNAIKAILAGAREACLVTPVKLEGDYATALADGLDISGFSYKQGMAECLPCDSDSFDFVMSSGCMHHTDTKLAFHEIHRVLGLGGRFAAMDPYRAPLYSLGIALFGKREAVDCTPLDRRRVAPLFDVFPNARVVLHGALLRYPMIVAGKLGFRPNLKMAYRISLLDDRIASLLGLRWMGSSVALLAEK